MKINKYTLFAGAFSMIIVGICIQDKAHTSCGMVLLWIALSIND